MRNMQDVTQEMKFLYLKRRTAELIECQVALKSKNFTYLEKIGHQVKGNAVSFGFGRFLPMALALEGAAQAKDTRRIEFILKHLNATVMDVVKRFEQLS